MRCQKARDFVSRELDGVLPAAETGKLRSHLDDCEDCQEYRAEVRLGQRLLAATEPRLPENFDWKLQLRLNRTMQEAVGEVQYPWHDEKSDRWVWLRNFGAATAVGLAAVLALAMFFGPAPQVDPAGGERNVAVSSDRRPLFQPGNGGLYQPSTQRLVSTAQGQRSGRAGEVRDLGWSGSSTSDLKTIRRLRAENLQLKTLLLQYQRANELMRTRLDTAGSDAIDLQEDN